MIWSVCRAVSATAASPIITDSLGIGCDRLVADDEISRPLLLPDAQPASTRRTGQALAIAHWPRYLSLDR